jgi:hypothetical protein
MSYCAVLPNYVNVNVLNDPNISITLEDPPFDFDAGNYRLVLTSLVVGNPPPSIVLGPVPLLSAQTEVFFNQPRVFSAGDIGVYLITIEYQASGGDPWDSTKYLVNPNINYFEVYNQPSQLFLLNNFYFIDPSQTTLGVGVYLLGVNSFFTNGETYTLTLNDGGTNVYQSQPFTVTQNLTYQISFNFNVTGGFAASDLYFGYINTFTEGTYNSLDIQLSCYLEGTKIQLADDRYVPIEELEEGELVKVFFNKGISSLPIKKVLKNRIHNTPYNKASNKLYIYRKEKNPRLFEDLVITGGHSLVVDQLSAQQAADTKKIWNTLHKINDKYLLLASVNEQMEEYTQEGFFSVYHIVLDQPLKEFESESEGGYSDQYIINSNGVFSETMSLAYYLDLQKKNNIFNIRSLNRVAQASAAE